MAYNSACGVMVLFGGTPSFGTLGVLTVPIRSTSSRGRPFACGLRRSGLARDDADRVGGPVRAIHVQQPPRIMDDRGQPMARPVGVRRQVRGPHDFVPARLGVRDHWPRSAVRSRHDRHAAAAFLLAQERRVAGGLPRADRDRRGSAPLGWSNNDIGDYDCEGSNDVGSVTSQSARFSFEYHDPPGVPACPRARVPACRATVWARATVHDRAGRLYEQVFETEQSDSGSIAFSSLIGGEVSAGRWAGGSASTIISTNEHLIAQGIAAARRRGCADRDAKERDRVLNEARCGSTASHDLRVDIADGQMNIPVQKKPQDVLSELLAVEPQFAESGSRLWRRRAGEDVHFGCELAVFG